MSALRKAYESAHNTLLYITDSERRIESKVCVLDGVSLCVSVCQVRCQIRAHIGVCVYVSVC